MIVLDYMFVNGCPNQLLLEFHTFKTIKDKRVKFLIMHNDNQQQNFNIFPELQEMEEG